MLEITELLCNLIRVQHRVWYSDLDLSVRPVIRSNWIEQSQLPFLVLQGKDQCPPQVQHTIRTGIGRL